MIMREWTNNNNNKENEKARDEKRNEGRYIIEFNEWRSESYY